MRVAMENPGHITQEVTGSSPVPPTMYKVAIVPPFFFL